MLPDLTVHLGPLTLPSPLILAASPWGAEAVKLAAGGLGALTMNSVGPRPRTGHPEPRQHEWGAGLINAVGLENPGAEGAVGPLRALKDELKEHGVTLIVSLFAETTRGYYDVARTLAQIEPELVEINISCPNVEEEFGTPFALDAVAAAEATAAAREALACPISVKLAPNAPDIVRIGEAVVRAGADMLTAVNTLPGLVIDVETRRPAISHGVGGISGEALRPVAVHAIYELYAALDVPIIGTGGVLRGRDAVELILAGATAVGLATVAHRHGAAGIRRVLTELDAWLSGHGIASLDAIRGTAHGS